MAFFLDTELHYIFYMSLGRCAPNGFSGCGILSIPRLFLGNLRKISGRGEGLRTTTCL